ncbi:MAG: phosphate acyltransferase PlsX [Anaerolineaceae bacterium]|nr:phosphate acyltransferase PlsX [Anaerolineaceae bacterium]
MTIILDAMGSDKYPDPEIEGAIATVKLIDNDIILVGDEKLITPKLNSLSPNHSRISVAHAPEVVDMWDKPVESAQKKPNNSMAVGVRLVKEGKGEAFVTAGNTGGAMFNALRILGRLKGVQRPALTAIFPTRKDRCIVVDIGANADCRPEFLQQFAVLGSIYAQNVLDQPNPRVGLLSNGEEAGKGNQLVKDSFKMLSESNINFIGNVEPKELFGGDADVVICDGFTGNILVKSSEAVAKMITDVLKDELMGSFRTKIGALLAKPAFSKMKNLVDPSEIGAAPLLGIDGLVFIGHGRSDARAIVSALLLADRAIKSGLMNDLSKKITESLYKQLED